MSAAVLQTAHSPSDGDWSEKHDGQPKPPAVPDPVARDDRSRCGSQRSDQAAVRQPSFPLVFQLKLLGSIRRNKRCPRIPSSLLGDFVNRSLRIQSPGLPIEIENIVAGWLGSHPASELSQPEDLDQPESDQQSAELDQPIDVHVGIIPAQGFTTSVFETSLPNSSKPSSCQTTFFVFGSTSIRIGWPGPAWQLPIT